MLTGIQICKRLWRVALFVAALNLGQAGTLSAQLETFADAWRWVKFTTEEGLPSNRVYQVLETKTGFVWAITDMGVAWYDGYAWHSVPAPAGILKGLNLKVSLAPNDRDLLIAMDGRLFQISPEGFQEIPVRTPQGKKLVVEQAVAFSEHGILRLAWPQGREPGELYLYSPYKLARFPSPGKIPRANLK
ncbi:MAG: hypothetical protein D6814_05920, partial [Calditrichaeota bacterium]